jgi:glyoxylase-like metal-dependent hydrolase (beta-lactamase superfamily II)
MANASRRIITIDSQYLQPQFAAAFLLIDGDRAAFIENNTAHSVPLLLAALEKEGLKPEQVEYLIITHVHLDHAGGSSALMRACPNATLLAHPRAAPHVIDPSKLVASARKVYGDEAFERLYGTIEAIPASRVRAVEDGEAVMLGSSPLKFMHTRGHANHHTCVLDAATKSIFTGDSFGIAYPALQSRGLFIFPSTSPTDFLAAEALASVARIRDSGAETAFLTHFGPTHNLKAAAEQLTIDLTFSDRLLNEAAKSPLADHELEGWIEPRLRAHFTERLSAIGLQPTPAIWDLLKLDIELNAQGLAHVARKQRAK